MQSDNSPVVENGVGFVTEFGAHFKKPEQGQVLASIRAEEYRCQQNIYTGESNIAAFSCGGLYSLSQHFRQDYNQSYLITKVRHHASQEIESWGNVGSTKYSNEFSCIPSGLTYRPSRITPKPRLYGIMNGTIDSEQDLGRADIDEQGRYKVKMPFDIGGAAPGQASRRIRMAQPYGGSGDDGQGAGMSFPLIKGAEVIWTCIDGDIDRPIITGVVPNPLQPSPTNTQNATSNVIKTTSGITMTFNDGIGGLNQNNSQSGPNIANQQNAQRLPVEQDLVNEQSQSEYRLGTENAEDVRQALQQQQQLVNVDTKSEMDSFFLSGVSGGAETEVGSEVNLQFKVPHIVNDYSGDDPDPRTRGKASVSGNSYLHMGDIPADWLYTDNYGAVEIRNGWFDYTDGDHVSVTQGKRTDIVKGGDYKQIISKGSVMGEDAATLHFDKFRKVGNGWRRTTAGYLSSDTYTWGDSEEFFGGFKFDGMAGLSTSAFIGGNCDLAIGANVNMQLAYDVNLGMASEFSYVAGSKYSITKDEAIEAREKIELYVEDSKGTDSMSKTFAAAIGVGTVVGGLTGVIGAASSALGRSVKKFDGEETAMASSIGAAAGLYAGAIAASIMAKKKKVSADQRETQIVLDDKKVTLQAGNGKLDKPSDTKFSSIVLETKSIKLTVGTSSITIKDKLVEFNAEEFKFTAGGSILDLKKDAGLDLKGEKGITVAKGGIVVTKGVIETKRGDVKCTKMEANELKTTSLAG